MDRLAVHLRDVVALIGRFPALSGVDLDMVAGEIVLVHGPNGAGKSTLLRLCAGLVAPAQGVAEVVGLDLRSAANRKAVRRQIGLLAHQGFLYDDLSVEDNVRFAVRAAGGDVSAIPAALHTLGLDGRLRGLPVHALSAGQRRRCALAPLLARRVPVWLLDEPHAGLDVAARDLLDAAVREAAAAGTAVLFASHDADRAVALATRSVALGGGHVLGGQVSDGQMSDGQVSDGQVSDGQVSDGQVLEGPVHVA